MAYSTTTLTGTYTLFDGTPAQGVIEIIPSEKVVKDTTGDVILSGRVKVTLDSAGKFSVDLPSTDDTTLNPTGFGYTLVAKLHHQHIAAVSFSLPAGSPVDIEDVTPVDPSTFTPDATYVQSTDLATVATTGAYIDLTGQPTIPTTAAEVGALPDTTTATDIGGETPTGAQNKVDTLAATLPSTYVGQAEIGAVNGVAPLDADGKVPSGNLPPGQDVAGAINAHDADPDAHPALIHPGDLVLNLMDYGAVGDGVADDTAAVQAFFTDLATNGGLGVVASSLLTNPTFKLTSTITFGPSSAGFVFDGGNRCTFTAGFATQSTFFRLTELDRVTLRNFEIDGVSSSLTSHGISCGSARDCLFENIVVRNYGNSAILTFIENTPSPGGPNARNTIAHCTAHGAGNANNGFLHEGTEASTLLNCKVYDLNRAGSPSYGLQFKNAADGCAIIGGYVRGAKAGVALGNTDNTVKRGVQVSGVTVENCNVGLVGSYGQGCRGDLTVICDTATQYAVSLEQAFTNGSIRATVLSANQVTSAVARVVGSANTVELQVDALGGKTLAMLDATSANNHIRAGRIPDLSLPAQATATVTDSGIGNQVTFTTDGQTPRAQAKQAANTTIANATETTLPLTAESYDTAGLHSDTTNPSRITFDRPGAWLIVGQVGYIGNATGRRLAIIWKNGAEVARATTFPTAANPAVALTQTIVDAAAGDYVELRTYQDSGVPLDTLASYVSMSAAFLGR